MSNQQIDDKDITRDKLMAENLEQRLRIEKVFMDAEEWNTKIRQPGEAKINPDPDGQLAEAWLLLQDANIVWSERFRIAMEVHFKKFRPEADLEKLMSDPNPYSPQELTAAAMRARINEERERSNWPDEIS